MNATATPTYATLTSAAQSMSSHVNLHGPGLQRHFLAILGVADAIVEQTDPGHLAALVEHEAGHVALDVFRAGGSLDDLYDRMRSTATAHVEGSDLTAAHWNLAADLHINDALTERR